MLVSVQKAGARNKRLQAENKTLKEQANDLQCILVAAVVEKDALARQLEGAGVAPLEESFDDSTPTAT